MEHLHGEEEDKSTNDDRSLTTRQGHPGHEQPVAAHRRQPRPGDAGELPLPREDQPLRPRAHSRARRARARLRLLRRVRGDRQDRRRAGLEVHAREAVPGGGQEDAAGDPLLHRDRRPRFVGGGARSARLRGQVLHRGRQLGSRRQQPAGVLHPRRDQVPGRDPLAEAGPGDVPAGSRTASSTS